MKNVKVGILGVGHLGRLHVQNYKSIANAEIVGIYDINYERCQEVARFQLSITLKLPKRA
ncbi:MAG: hypothetical protein MUC94_06910 [bacterium]|nr:hypothetical protein [bacterium]